MFDLHQSSQLLRVLSEPTRLRLLLLLEQQSLTVAELTAATGLAQSRVSTHLGRLRQAGLLHERREAAGVLLAVDPAHFDARVRQLWGALVDNLDDSQLRLDLERAAEIVRRRHAPPSWVESVAGRMERQYSPGRTWEATARALVGLLHLGDVLDVASGDGVLAELLSARAVSVTCLDRSRKVIEAARQRLTGYTNVSFRHGDMHDLPFAEATFDHVFLTHALTYTNQPHTAIERAAAVLRPAGALILTTLACHRHRATVAAFDHVNLGFSVAQLRNWVEAAGLDVECCETTSRESRPPFFEVITVIARKPNNTGMATGPRAVAR